MKISCRALCRLLVLGASVLCLCFPASGNTPKTLNESARHSHPARGQRAVKIPFEITSGGHIFLRVRVNGSEPLWFGLDSGAEQTMISRQQAKALNLKLQGEMQAAGGGEGTEDFSLTKNVSFSLNGVNFALPEVGVLALAFPSPVGGQPVGGLLGYDFISRFVVEIDYAAQTLSLYSPRRYRYRGSGQSVRIRMLDNNPHIPVKVTLPGLAPIVSMFIIDSGADTDLFFNSPFVTRHKLLTSAQETTEASTLGLGGASKIRIGHATSIQIGRAVIANPVAHFSQASKGDSASNISAGFIGGKLLRQFKTVIFDQARRRLILEPNQ